MAALTELELRQLIRERGEIESVTVPPGTLITPAARQFLQERRIKLIFGEPAGPSRSPAVAVATPPAPPAGAPAPAPAPAAAPAGAPGQAAAQAPVPQTFTPQTKPGELTHLRGKLMVPKTHPRIRFRGKLDSLEAYILLAQNRARTEGLAELDRNLGEVLDFVRKMVRAEVMDEPLPPIQLFGLDAPQLRERSHYPQKYFGVPHTAPVVEHGEMMLWLNLLRTQVRETELAAVQAFWQEDAPPERLDIIQALNRLSSAIWILMMQHLAQKGGTSGGER